MPNISIDQLQIFDSLDGSQIFPHVHPSNNVTYHAHVSAIFYNDAVTENVIKDEAVTTNKIADNAVNNDKIANTENFTFNNTTVNKLIVSDQVTIDHLRLNQLDYTFPAIREANKFLKHTSSGVLEWATASEVAGGGSGTINLVFNETLPVGAITQWSSTDTPAGWLFCNGQGFDGTQYPELKDIVGDTYKVHDGNTYYLPDFRGRVPVGVGQTNDINSLLSSFTLGLTGGEFMHQLSVGEMPKHKHGIQTSHEQGGGKDTRGYPAIDGSPEFIFHSADEIDGSVMELDGRGNCLYDNGGDEYHNNIQPYLASNYIIKAKKDTLVNFAPTLGRGLSAKDADGTINTTSLNLTSSEIGILADDNDFEFDGDKRLHLKPTALLPKYKQLTGGTIELRQEIVNPGSIGNTFTWSFDDFVGTDVDMTRVAAIYVDVRIELGYQTDQFTPGSGGDEPGSNILVYYTYPERGEHLVADDFLDVDVVNAQNQYAYVSRKHLLLPIDYVPGGTFVLKVISNDTVAGRRCTIHLHGVQQFGG